jgi:2-succinyl-5-enolpyruvyl-6-hydroxy-3-cyclohexene-1-carboxylate synthase
MGNVDRATELIDALVAAGVREACVCAGSRNSPLLVVLGSRDDLRIYSFVDERSAVFFALGRWKLHGAPVAIVTTSGTAVAEMLPGAVEAYYSGAPLVLVSADRPERFRGTGAPQSIEQIGIFGVYAETSLASWSRTKPLHVNIEFDEPLIDGVVASPAVHRRLPAPVIPSVSDGPVKGGAEQLEVRASKSSTLARAADGDNPLVIIGALPRHQQTRVREFVAALGAPVFAEPLSGLREDASLPLITAGERMIDRLAFDSVIRIGGIPTLRFWRDLENSQVPVTHYSEVAFTGMPRGKLYPIEALPHEPPRVSRDEAFFERDRSQASALGEILDTEPESELAMFRALSRSFADAARVYLGNSLPIREWDLAAIRDGRGFEYEANRGANGIDGQLSTFFGWCAEDRENVCIVGDLTAIYDLGAPWIVPQLEGVRFRIVVVNNGGGRIFARVPSLRVVAPDVRRRMIENTHAVRFGQWAAMWDIEVTELTPDAAASERAWARYDALWT